MTKHKKLKLILGILLFIVLVGVLYFVLQKIDERDTVETDGEDTYLTSDNDIIFGGKIYELDHPVKSYLIMGTDGSGNENVKGEQYEGSMADFLMLMVIDEADKKYGFLALNRDSVAEIPMMDKNGQVDVYNDMYLCLAHAYGGSKRQSCINTVNAVSSYLHDVPIGGYLAIPMDHISDLNHVLGGVTVTLEDDFTAEDAQMKPGETITLTDEQAAIFLRGRMDVGDGTNLSRMRRQKAYLEAASQKIREQNAQDAKFLAKAYDQIMTYATSDLNMNVITKLAKNMDQYESLGFLQIEGETKLGNDRIDDGQVHNEFYADETSLKENVMKLYPLVDTGKTEDD